MSYWAQRQGLQKRCDGAQSDSPETKSSTAVSFLPAFAGENLALVKPVVGPLSPEEGACVRGPITHPESELCWVLALRGPRLPLALWRRGLSSSAIHGLLRSVGASSGPWPGKHCHPCKQHKLTGAEGWISFENRRCSG